MEVNGAEVVQHYGDPLGEHRALRQTAGVMDLSPRGRICLTGSDRVRFLNGQVTNNIKILQPGRGCYAALVTAKGRMESDLHVHVLQDELLLDFEPGLTATVMARLEKYVVADDVQVTNLKPLYGLLSVQGPKAREVLTRMDPRLCLPESEYQSTLLAGDGCGDWILVCLARLNTQGYDLVVPSAALGTMMDRLTNAAKAVGGCVCGWDAMEMARIEAGIPRFGQDMDETNIPLEAGLEARAIRYDKGCYIGQEVINRIHSIGQVTKSLRGLVLPRGLPALPARGDKLRREGREVGYITSALNSPSLNRGIAMGYVRKEVNEPGTTLQWITASGEVAVEVVALPFEVRGRAGARY